jgi:hypothetical protein
MKAIANVLVSTALGFGAIGAASAQTYLVETEYPGPEVPSASSTTPTSALLTEPYLIQSSQGAVEVNPVYSRREVPLSRARVQRILSEPVGPAFNA